MGLTQARACASCNEQSTNANPVYQVQVLDGSSQGREGVG